MMIAMVFENSKVFTNLAMASKKGARYALIILKSGNVMLKNIDMNTQEEMTWGAAIERLRVESGR